MIIDDGKSYVESAIQVKMEFYRTAYEATNEYLTGTSPTRQEFYDTFKTFYLSIYGEAFNPSQKVQLSPRMDKEEIEYMEMIQEKERNNS